MHLITLPRYISKASKKLKKMYGLQFKAISVYFMVKIQFNTQNTCGLSLTVGFTTGNSFYFKLVSKYTYTSV